MLLAFFFALGQLLRLWLWSLLRVFRGKTGSLPRRLAVLLIGMPLYSLLQCLHWLGFAADEIFFRRYRRVNINRPIFISGVPRSGTTHLQRVLVQHQHLTSMQTWECIFAPSITERYCYRAVFRLIQPLNAWLHPLRRLPVFAKMQAIHQLGWQQAEEDFIALLPINACFLLVLLFPTADHYWRLVEFDLAVPQAQKRRILQFYAKLIQKHLYVHGSDLRYLAKNPSFLTWTQALANQFPGACFVICERAAQRTVPSQLSSLQPAWRALYATSMSKEFSQRLVTMLANYYHYIERLPYASINAMPLPMSRLVSDLAAAINQVIDHCELEVTEDFAALLQKEVAKASTYRSKHTYCLDTDFDWTKLLGQFPKSAEKQAEGA